MMVGKEQSTKQVVKKEAPLPAWFHKNQEVEETSKEEQEELDKMLRELV